MNPNEQAVAEAYAILEMHVRVFSNMVLNGPVDAPVTDQFRNVLAARSACLKLQPEQKAA